MSQNEIKKAMELVDNVRADKYPADVYTYVGRRGVRRIDGVEKANGAALYTIDVNLPGMLYLRFFTCPYPHARIVRMDTSKAEALPGVRVVLRYDDPELPTGADLGGHFPSNEPPIPHIAYFDCRAGFEDNRGRVGATPLSSGSGVRPGA
jgi:CO/xanthine dehydrogenase Mo-binding subunit